MSKIPASSKLIWDLLVNESDVFENDKPHQLHPNHLDPPEPQHYGDPEDPFGDPTEVDNPLNNKPVPFELAKQFCFVSSPFELNLALRTS